MSEISNMRRISYRNAKYNATLPKATSYKKNIKPAEVVALARWERKDPHTACRRKGQEWKMEGLKAICIHGGSFQKSLDATENQGQFTFSPPASQT